MTDIIITIIVAVISATGAGLGVAILTRKKTLSEAKLADAQAAQVIVRMATEAAKELVTEYQKRLEAVEVELVAQAHAIESLNGENLRYRYIIDIFYEFVVQLGVTPPLTRSDIEQMPNDELKRVSRQLRKRDG